MQQAAGLPDPAAGRASSPSSSTQRCSLFSELLRFFFPRAASSSPLYSSQSVSARPVTTGICSAQGEKERGGHRFLQQGKEAAAVSSALISVHSQSSGLFNRSATSKLSHASSPVSGSHSRRPLSRTSRSRRSSPPSPSPCTSQEAIAAPPPRTTAQQTSSSTSCTHQAMQ